MTGGNKGGIIMAIHVVTTLIGFIAGTIFSI